MKQRRVKTMRREQSRPSLRLNPDFLDDMDCLVTSVITYVPKDEKGYWRNAWRGYIDKLRGDK